MTSSPRSGVRGSHVGIWLAALVLVAAVASVLVAGGARSASPQGLIAFGRNSGLYVMRTDGSGVHPVWRRGSVQDLAWSPDGDWIVFRSERDGGPEIYVIRADGSDATRLTFDGAGNSNPRWLVGR